MIQNDEDNSERSESINVTSVSMGWGIARHGMQVI